MSDIKTYTNETIIKRLDSLIEEGKRLWDEFKNNEDGLIMDIISMTKWTTSSLNLLDKLSISTNRFVTQFEIWILGGPGKQMNIGAALGVLKSAKEEYEQGLAVEYHLSVSAVVFSGILDEASYLLNKKYLRASAVLIGAALEEGLKTRARSEGIDISKRETLNPLIQKLQKTEYPVITSFEARELEVVAKMRNDAAHGGEFNYQKEQVESQFRITENILNKLLSQK